LTDPTLHLALRDRVDSLASVFRDKGRVQIRDALEEAGAQAIHETLVAQKEWNLVYTHAGRHIDSNATAVAGWPETERRKLDAIVHAEAAIGFQYFYANIPIYDLYHRGALPGRVFERLFEFLNGEEFLGAMRAITGANDIAFADAQATRFGPGHFLTSHDDAVLGKDRRVAYVLSLSPGWRRDWGGALQFFDALDNVEEAFTPSFNALNLFRIPAAHSVGVVAPFAQAPRYAITGWLRAGRDPGIS